MKHTIDTKVLQEVLKYLATRPYVETHALIDAIQKNAVLVEEAKLEEKAS